MLCMCPCSLYVELSSLFVQFIFTVIGLCRLFRYSASSGIVFRFLGYVVCALCMPHAAWESGVDNITMVGTYVRPTWFA